MRLPAEPIADRGDDGFAHPALSNLVGKAPAFVESLRLVHRVAASDVTVLICGETGTGKELVARAIHYLGPRKDYPFIPVNCGAIPDDLVENEFFGHVRGAFTGAKDAQKGLVANAEGGTLFLDEIECLSPRAQAALLRFLQDHSYRPLGGGRPVIGNVRIIAASNADLAQLSDARLFRQDLLYRLAIAMISLPALRERPGDVLLLAQHFLGRFSREYAREERQLSAKSIEMLLQHEWAGNVRELENVIHRAVLMTDDPEIELPDPIMGSETPSAPADVPLPIDLPVELGFRRAKAMVVAEFEKRFVRRALVQSHGNVSEAARISGKERRAFGKLLKKYGIAPAMRGEEG